MSQNTLYNQIVVNLMVLSKIQDNGRVSTSNPCFISIESDSFFQSLWRRFNGDSRKSAVRTIKTFIGNAFEYTKGQMEFMQDCATKESLNRYEKSKYEEFKKQLETIREKLNSSINGIQKLKMTYKDDQTIIAEIDVIIDDIHNHVEKIEKNVIEYGNLPLDE